MRNVFDQYEQPENRLTHAMMSAVAADRSLIRPFLRFLGAKSIPRLSDIHLVEQQVPGTLQPGEEAETATRAGLPDGCFFTDVGWALLIESKVQAKGTLDQLRRHRVTADRHGFQNAQVVLLDVTQPKWTVPDWATFRNWTEVYQWFCRRRSGSLWAARFVDYVEIFESRMSAKGYQIEGALTVFNGIHFGDDNPYTWQQGKRAIKMLGDELRKVKRLHKIGLDPTGKGRPAITGRGSERVWDFLPLKAARKAGSHTSLPHFTLDLAGDHVEAAVTVPNGVKGGLRTRLRDLGEDQFIEFFCDIYRRSKMVCAQSQGSRTFLYALQRHYKSQRSPGVVDGRINADLRTVVKSKTDGVKYQPEWILAIYYLLTQKRSNIQLGLVTHFKPACPKVQSRKVVDLIADAWIAGSPLIDLILGRA